MVVFPHFRRHGRGDLLRGLLSLEGVPDSGVDTESAEVRGSVRPLGFILVRSVEAINLEGRYFYHVGIDNNRPDLDRTDKYLKARERSRGKIYLFIHENPLSRNEI